MKKYYALKSFGSYIKQFKWRFTLSFFTFAISDVFLALMPLFVGKLVGALSAQKSHSSIYTLTAILVALSILHDSTWRLAEYVYRKVINPLTFEYETIAFKRVIDQPYPYFVDKFTGKVASYVATLGRELRSFIETVTFTYADQLIKLVGMALILFSVNWQTGLIFVASLVGMFFVGKHTIKNSAAYEQKFTDRESDKNGQVIDIMSNFINVKSFRREHNEHQYLVRTQKKLAKSADESFFWNVVFWASMSLFVRWIIWPSTIIFNVYLYMHHQLTVQQLTTFLSVLLLFSDYIWGSIWNISQFNLKRARINEAYDYLFGTRNIIAEYYAAKEKPKHVITFASELKLSNLTFAYPDKPKEPIIKGISLAIKKGEKIGVVGRSGSGKTTITKLLLGYYELPDGSFELDGQPVTYTDIVDLISYVPQDTTLFHRTIKENIAYATDVEVTEAEVIAAAKKAHAHEFINKLSDGYDSLVGERGVKLSTGQRQRIAIARALLVDKPLLILDEATSALDSESEVLVQDALENLWHDKTVIAIAHRLSTLRHMDKIIVMEAGEIIEFGTHTQLLKKKGAYYRLWQHQSNGMLAE